VMTTGKYEESFFPTQYYAKYSLLAIMARNPNSTKSTLSRL